jgi:deazaflavin-dependent oxidoreductase (nitroreductase family)
VSRLPLMRHFALPLDRAVAWLTGGRFTMTTLVTGLPMVQLTTTGARSGRLRTVFLVGMAHGDDVILIASNFGQKRHPAWYHNLTADPQVMLSVAGQSARLYRAREAVGAERQRLWREVVDLYPGYARYARRAGSRQIPVILLAPLEMVPDAQEFG